MYNIAVLDIFHTSIGEFAVFDTPETLLVGTIIQREDGAIWRIIGTGLPKPSELTNGYINLDPPCLIIDFKIEAIDKTKKLQVGDKLFKLAINTPIVWTGDLSDDCTAIWNGLILRAEWMDKNIWWWAVSVNDGRMDEIDSSNNYGTPCIGGDNARRSAEQAALNYLSKVIA